MEDQFSDSSFDEANRLIHSAFNSPYAMHHAKNVAIRKQLLESAIQKLLESKTFYISDVRDIAAMNNRAFDSRSKLYEQMNILNCREYRKMRLAVLELLPLMIHRATGIPEQRFTPIVDANRPAAERPAEPAAVPATAGQAPAIQPAPSAAAVPAPASIAAAAEAVSAARTPDAGPAAMTVANQSEAASATVSRSLPLLLSLSLNLLLGAALLASVLPSVSDAQASRNTAAPLPSAGSSASPLPAASSRMAPVSLSQSVGGDASKPYVVDSIIRTALPAESLSQMAVALAAEKAAGQQYIIGVRVEKVVN